MLQSETDGADGHTYSLFQENSSAALQTPTDLKGFDMMTVVRRLAEQEHFAALGQLRSRISAITKFGADADNDPFVKEKDLIMDFSRLQAEASPETSKKSHCDEEASKATEMKEDLGAEVAKHSSELLSVVYKNAVDSRRAVWRVITSIEQKEKSKSEEQLASHAREYIAKVEGELQKIREGVLALMDKKLIRSPCTDESKALYHKMKSDYHRYLAEQDTEVPKTSSRDRTLQRAAEQIPNVPVPETVSRDGVQQRTVEQIVDAPVPQIVKMPVTQQTQHVVNTVEVEKPKLIKETVQEKINQVTKHIKIPQVQFLNKVDDMLVDVQRQIPVAQTVQKTTESPQLQFLDQAVDTPVVVQRQVPQVHVVKKTVEISQLQAVEKIVETPETQTIQGAMKHDDPDAKIKFFTEEALHGVGGLIFDAHGNCVANELGKRDCVTEEMWENKPPFSLALNSAVSDDTAWQCKHYTGRGLRKLHESGTAPAEDLEALVSRTPDSIEAHYQASLKTARNPNGEPYPAFTSDKSWDEASGKTVAHRQVPLIQRVQKMVEVPQVQFIDKVADAPACVQNVLEIELETSTHVTENTPSTWTGVNPDVADSVNPVLSTDETEEDTCVHAVVPASSHAHEELDDTTSEMECVKEELREMRKMLQFLVRRERKVDMKTEVAAKKLQRLEREREEEDDKEHEASLIESLADKTKVVKLVVDKWFVDKGFGFGKVPTGETVFIHASTVVGAEVLTIGTDAWVQVVNDDARAQGAYRARRAWGQTAWREERDRGRANRVAQQVRRAAALTAELAAQSEEKVAVVCDHPPGLHDEPAKHITAPNMGAGGSHPQAEMMHHSQFANPLPPTGKEFFKLARELREGRSRSTTRAQEGTSLIDETLNFFVKATGKDETSMRQQLTSQKRDELRRSRDHWKARAEEEERLHKTKEEAWRLFERMPGFKRKTREMFEEEFTRKARNAPDNSRKEREKAVQEWSNDMKRVIQPEERKREARERMRMEQEDSSSQRHRVWEKIWDPQVLALSPFLAAGN